VWDFLSPERLATYAPFLQRYQAIRQREGRERAEGEYYRSLPFVELAGPIGQQWQIRARNFRAFLSWLTTEFKGPLRIADLGAGCAWLSHRLSELDHQLVAIDLLAGREDGLGSARHYETRFARARAEFDRLPLVAGSLDIVIYNGSFHYSTDFETTLREALHVLKPSGTIVIFDSPVFRQREAGRRMLAEREEIADLPAGPAEGFLDSERTVELGTALGLDWQRIDVRQDLRWELESWRRRFRRLREPARFPLLIARRPER
jgi:SAM-dependent methyltransferase